MLGLERNIVKKVSQKAIQKITVSVFLVSEKSVLIEHEGRIKATII